MNILSTDRDNKHAQNTCTLLLVKKYNFTVTGCQCDIELFSFNEELSF